MCTDLITASGLRSLHDRAVDPAGQERLEHRDQPARGQLVDRPPARLQHRDRARVVQVDAVEHLAGVEPRRRDGRGVVAGHAVVELEREPASPPRFIEATTTLSSSAPSSSRSSRMSAVASRPSTPGRPARSAAGRAGRCGCPWPSAAPGAERAAGRVVGGDEHQPAVAANGGPGRRRRPRPADGAAGRGAQLGDRGVVASRSDVGTSDIDGLHGGLVSASAATSAAVGMAVEHSSREATMAPAALA